MDTKIISQLEDTFVQEFDLVRRDFSELETVIKEKMLLLGKGLLQRLVDRQANGYKGSSILCQCGNAMKFVQHRARDIHTLFGWIRIKRAYYHCSACGTGKPPYDDTSGLGSEQLSPALAKTCCLLAVDDSFGQASRKLKEICDQHVSETTIERVVHQVGAEALEHQYKGLEETSQPRVPPRAEAYPVRLYVTADGTTVPEKDAWHEAKVGCIYWAQEQDKRTKRYLAGFCDSELFGWHLWREACRCGLREAKEVVYIGDGAGWIRTEHSRHFSKATFIIDWYHACEHVWECGKVLFGDCTKTHEWVEKRLSLLWEGCTKKLLDDLKRLRKQHRRRKREAIDGLFRYISTNEQQMCYDVFRSKGYDIGSGAVEGACKHVVGRRLKQSGMKWIRAGSSAVLALRVTWLNGRWEKLWTRKPLAA